MKPRLSREKLEERVRARMRELGRAGVSIAGSLVRIRRRCGRANCQCHRRGGEPHPAWVLTSKVRGRTKAVYVPVALVKDVAQWVSTRRRLRQRLKQIDALAEQIIRRAVPAARAARRSPARAPTRC